MYTPAPMCPNCSDVLHYLMRHPFAAVAAIAFLTVASAGFGITVFAYNDVDFGTDELAEQYYQAILVVHNETGFNDSEYAPSGLTVEQAKEIICINTDDEAKFWLAEERNNLTGRLYYYILLGWYQAMLSSGDDRCGSCLPDGRYYITEILEDPSIVKLDATICNMTVYDLATIAYFYNTTIVDEFVKAEDCSMVSQLPTDELNRVLELLAEAEAEAAKAAAEADAAG